MSALLRSCIVVGGGIGGLTVANALLRRGVAVNVYERAPAYIATAGAGFGFSPNGQACLKHIGFEDKDIHPLLHHFHTHTVVGRNGKTLYRCNIHVHVRTCSKRSHTESFTSSELCTYAAVTHLPS